MGRNIAKEIVDGLTELAESLEKGLDVSRKFNIREVEVDVRPTKYSPSLVKKTRGMLNASQAVLAKFLGVQPTTVRAWECGNNTPSGMAARFLDEIRANPSLFKARMIQVMKPKERGNRPAKAESRGARARARARQ